MVIQRQSVDHLYKATDITTTSTKLSEWYESDNNARINMLVLDHEITAFACISDRYLTVVKGLSVSRDLIESRHKVVSGCAG